MAVRGDLEQRGGRGRRFASCGSALVVRARCRSRRRPVVAAPVSWLLLALAAVGCAASAASQASDALTRACGPSGAGNLSAVFRRTTFTPLLLLSRRGSSEPCALLKLSCRLLSNAQHFHVAESGLRVGREPFGHHTWAEVLVHAALWRSRSARAVLAPHSGGAAVAAAAVELRSADAARVPSTCVWPGDTLVGHLQSFEPGVVGGEHALKRALAPGAPPLSDNDVAALAAWTLADALTLNTDRSVTRNTFARPDGRLIALDLSCPGCWELSCPGAAAEPYEHAMRKLLAAPNALRGSGHTDVCAGALRTVLAAAHRIAREMCGKVPECANLRKHLERFTDNDPWFIVSAREAQKVTQPRPGGLSCGSCGAPMCCESAPDVPRPKGARSVRVCQACAGPFRGWGTSVPNTSCFAPSLLRSGFGRFLAADAARRTEHLARELDAMTGRCSPAAADAGPMS